VSSLSTFGIRVLFDDARLIDQNHAIRFAHGGGNECDWKHNVAKWPRYASRFLRPRYASLELGRSDSGVYTVCSAANTIQHCIVGASQVSFTAVICEG